MSDAGAYKQEPRRVTYDRSLNALTNLINGGLNIKVQPWEVENLLQNHFNTLSGLAHTVHRNMPAVPAVQPPKAGAPSGWATFQLWNDPSRLVAVDASTVTAVVSDNQGDNTRTTIKSTHGTWTVAESWNVVLQRLNAAKETGK